MLERLNWLLANHLDKITNKTVLVIGLGGVGSYALETLVRTGIKNLIIVDHDTIDISNLNRQLMSLTTNVGQFKVDVWEDRIKQINPLCNIYKIKEFITVDNINLLFENKIDYVIDACDTINTKLEIIKYCLNNNIKFISSMGMANRIDATKIKITSLDKTSNDPLAKKLRLLVQKENIKGKIPVVCSLELPIKSNKLGSIAHVVATSGLLCTNYIINDILGETNEKGY